MRGVLLLLLLSTSSRADVDKNAASVVTELVTAALAKESRFSVLASTDVKRQLEVEAGRSVLGCDESRASCLAEVAGAMGAQLVVYGKLGTLDDVIILTLHLFDSRTAQAAGRVVVREVTLAKLGDRIDSAVAELVRPYTASLAEGTRVKLLVLDVEPPGDPSDAVSPAQANGPSPLAIGALAAITGGGVVSVLGVVSLIASAGAHEQALDQTTPQVDAQQAHDDSQVLGFVGLGATGIGVLALAGGAALWMVGGE